MLRSALHRPTLHMQALKICLKIPQMNAVITRWKILLSYGAVTGCRCFGRHCSFVFWSIISNKVYFQDFPTSWAEYEVKLWYLSILQLRCDARLSESVIARALNCQSFIYLFSRLYNVSTSSCAHLAIILFSSSSFLCHSSLLPSIPFPHQSSNSFRPGKFRSTSFSSSWWGPFHKRFWYCQSCRVKFQKSFIAY